MEILHQPGPCPELSRGTALTIGAYDGVHLGHRRVIAEVCRVAKAEGLASAVVTFDRHPAVVVRPESAPLLLCDLPQKLELLATTGIDYTVVVRFDEERAAESAGAFVEELLVKCLGARLVVVGADFHFGKGREGDVPFLQRSGEKMGFRVEGVELVGADGSPASERERVSSTRIRHCLRAGELAQANALLGRPYEVRGKVADGDHRGRQLGFPTANVAVPGDVLLPADGIYAGWYERPGGSVHRAAISLGRRPTFYDEAHASLLEAHLLDFAGELYGEPARVRFVQRLRGEERFASSEALVAQIQADCDDARRVLS
jgi:riboflavin kinase/FMN adenylyltransferase